MTVLFVCILCGFSLIAGKYLFRFIVNPISIYTAIWGIEVVLYELKLIRYFDLSTRTWLVIGSAFFCYGFGVLTYFLALRSLDPSGRVSQPGGGQSASFVDNPRFLTFLIFGFSMVGLVGAAQHWMVLFKMFGSLIRILMNAPVIYALRVQGRIHGVIPYLCTFPYVAVFFSGLYTAKTGKWNAGTFLAFLSVILEDLANVGRTGMFFVFIEFFTVVVVYRLAETRNRQFRIVNRKLVLSVAVLFAFLAVIASAVKTARIGFEEYKSASRSLNKLRNNVFITPSIYIYFSAQLGVLNKYLDQEKESAVWGENTFLPVYNLIAKTGLIKKPAFYQKGYFVPMWNNTGTYLREVHADFGYAGIFIFPYLLGLGITHFWRRYFMSKNLTDLAILVYLLLIVYFSFQMIIARLGIWWISLILLLLTIETIRRIRGIEPGR
jgi:oligosaccharide repeat unit polymerase